MHQVSADAHPSAYRLRSRNQRLAGRRADTLQGLLGHADAGRERWYPWRNPLEECSARLALIIAGQRTSGLIRQVPTVVGCPLASEEADSIHSIHGQREKVCDEQPRRSSKRTRECSK